MVALNFKPVSEEDLSNQKKFRTYSAYLISINKFLSAFETEELLQQVANSKSFESIRGGKCQDLHAVKKLLKNCWSTEIQLHLPTVYEDLGAISNQWATVQLYYAIYISSTALLKASNQVVAQSHNAVLSGVAQIMESKPDLFFHPLNLLCRHDNGAIKFLNVPDHVEIKEASNLSNEARDDVWASLPKFLKTTREKQLKEKYNEHKKRNRIKRLIASEKQKINDKTAPTSILSCLKRLREISNYQDADYLISGVINEDEAAEFNVTLRCLSWYLLLNLELLIARNVGKETFQSWINTAPECELGDLSQKLFIRRWAIIKKAW